MKKDRPAHSKLGGSCAYRYLMCPGSVDLCEEVEDTTTSYALEGTAAHELARECHAKKVSPYSYINGGTVTVEDEDTGEQIEYEVTADMASAVMVYLQEVTALENQLGVEAGIEQTFHMDWIDDELWGKNDCKISLDFDTLHIWDYKHGAGVFVDAVYPQPKTYFCGGVSDKNPQIMYYALGAIGPTNEHNVMNIEGGIIQPRIACQEGVARKFNVSLEELYRWRDEILIPGIAATRQPNAPLIPGDHCQFCNAIGICPKVALEATKTAGIVPAAKVFSETVVFPDPKDLTPEQRCNLYLFSTAFGKWMEAVKKQTNKDALAGVNFPGLKVVLGNTKRDWIDPDAAETAVVKLIGVDAYVSKFVSPAQAEKKLKDEGKDPEVITKLIKSTRGKTVALESDKRKAINVQTAADVFNK